MERRNKWGQGKRIAHAADDGRSFLDGLPTLIFGVTTPLDGFDRGLLLLLLLAGTGHPLDAS